MVHRLTPSELLAVNYVSSRVRAGGDWCQGRGCWQGEDLDRVSLAPPLSWAWHPLPWNYHPQPTVDIPEGSSPPLKVSPTHTHWWGLYIRKIAIPSNIAQIRFSLWSGLAKASFSIFQDQSWCTLKLWYSVQQILQSISPLHHLGRCAHSAYLNLVQPFHQDPSQIPFDDHDCIAAPLPS